MKQSNRVRKRVTLSACLLGSCLVTQQVRSEVHVHLDSSPLGSGVFQYELSVVNSGLEDIAIVSVVDAPVSDALIGSTLQAPVGFNAIYDPGAGLSFGFIDLLEDTALFAAATSTSGFHFQSEATPPENFTLFEAISVARNIISGTIQMRTVPETGSTLLLAGLGVAGLFLVHEKRSLLKN